MNSKLILGSAQFGFDYGVTNKDGIVNEYEVRGILDLAHERGLRLIDTARFYGHSEEVLGVLHQNRFSFITKFAKVPATNSLVQMEQYLRGSLETSLKTLRSDEVEYFLAHNAEEFLTHHQAILPVIKKFKSEGVIKKFGISLYNPDQALATLEVCKPDVLQFPVNVFDQRFYASGVLDKLKANNVEVHIRSVFLQGIILQKPSELDPFFNFFQAHYNDYANKVKLQNMNLTEAALKFVLNDSRIDKVIVGVCSKNQLVEIINAEKSPIIPDFDYGGFAFHDERLINPLSWPMLKK